MTLIHDTAHDTPPTQSVHAEQEHVMSLEQVTERIESLKGMLADFTDLRDSYEMLSKNEDRSPYFSISKGLLRSASKQRALREEITLLSLYKEMYYPENSAQDD